MTRNSIPETNSGRTGAQEPLWEAREEGGNNDSRRRKRRGFRPFFAGVAALALAAGGAWAVETSAERAEAAVRPATMVEADYSVYLAGLRFGSVALEAMVDQERYAVSSLVKTEGLADFFARQVFDVASAGLMSGPLPAPERFKSDFADEDSARRLEFTFTDTGPGDVVATPPYTDPPRYPVPPLQRFGTVDPASALLMPLKGGDAREECARTLPVFDGKRRYDFELTYAGEEFIGSRDPGSFSGDTLRCSAVYKPIAGFKEKTIAKMTENPPVIDIWLVRLEDLGVMVPVRFSVSTPFGAAVGKVTRFEVSETTQVSRALN